LFRLDCCVETSDDAVERFYQPRENLSSFVLRAMGNGLGALSWTWAIVFFWTLPACLFILGEK
jgi:hypothetical protein